MNPVILSAMTRAAAVEHFELLAKKLVAELDLSPISYWKLRSAAVDLKDAAAYWEIAEQLKGGDRKRALRTARNLETAARDRITPNIWKYLIEEN